VIPNGVDLPELMPERKRSRSTFHALYLSRLHPVKGVLDLIDAWRRIKSHNSSISVNGVFRLPAIVEEGYDAVIKDAIRINRLEKELICWGQFMGGTNNTVE